MASEIDLEHEFKKIKLQPDSGVVNDDSATKCSCKKHQHPTLFLDAALKTKDRRKNLIRPARLKVIGRSFSKSGILNVSEGPVPSSSTQNKKSMLDKTEAKPVDDDDFTTEAFLKMRISPPDPASSSSELPSSDDKASSSPTSNNSCSFQAKLHHQMSASSSSEYSSTIEEMSDFLSYHLSLHSSRDNNFLVDSMYT